MQPLKEIMVVPRSFVTTLGDWDGVRSLSKFEADSLGSLARFYLRTDELETDDSWKQIIPYAVLRYNDEVFSYRRGKLGAESRLHGLRSIGVGGHVDYEDYSVDDAKSIGLSQAAWKAINLAAHREVAEEVGFDSATLSIKGLINEDQTKVGRVHLGILFEAKVNPFHISSREPCLVEPKFEKLGEIDPTGYELWSQMTLGFLRDGARNA